MAICHAVRGGCGWRSPVFASRPEAERSAARHRVLCIGDAQAVEADADELVAK